MSAFTNKARHKLIKSHNHALTQLRQKKKKKYKELEKLYKKKPEEEPQDGGKQARQLINDQFLSSESALLDQNSKELEVFDAHQKREADNAEAAAAAPDTTTTTTGNPSSGGGGGGSRNTGATKKLSRYEKRKQKQLAEEAQMDAARSLLENGLENEKEIEIEQITTLLEPLGLGIQDIKADGHCLFTSIAHQLALRNGEEFDNSMLKACKEMRQIATSYMRNNSDSFAPFVEGDFNAYCDTMSTTAAWGGQIEIQALSDALQTPVEVYAAGQPVLTMGETYGGVSGNGLQPLRVTYHRKYYTLGEHYNSVVLL